MKKEFLFNNKIYEKTYFKMPSLLEISGLERLTQSFIDGNRVEIRIFLELVHQRAARDGHGEFSFAELLQAPQRRVVIDAVIDCATVEKGLCKVHCDGILFLSWHAVASLQNFHHFRCVHVEAEALRPYGDDDAHSEFEQQQHQNENKIESEKAAVVQHGRPVADEGDGHNDHAKDCKRKSHVEKKRLLQIL